MQCDHDGSSETERSESKTPVRSVCPERSLRDVSLLKTNDRLLLAFLTNFKSRVRSFSARTFGMQVVYKII